MDNIELLPKHTNPLPIKEDTKIQSYKKHDAIIIPEGATNGDMMKAVFPDESAFNGGEGVGFKKEWWEAPYNIPRFKTANLYTLESEYKE